jgi:hypothetical protein
MGKVLKRERKIGRPKGYQYVQIQEEKWHLKEKVQMFDWRIAELEKDLDTSTKLFPLLKECFVECQHPLAIVRADWDKSKVQLVQLGEKVIQLDNWQNERFTQMMAQLYQ